MGKKRRDGRASRRGKNYASSNAAGGEGHAATGIRYGTGTYQGELKDGKPHGKGIFRYADGNEYEGEFVEGEEHGKGTFKWKAGEVYVGEWKGGKQHGWGINKWNDGDEYEGEFQDDKMHGKGAYRWFDGRVYEGEWVEEKQHGRGAMTWPSGKMYEGQWAEGEKHGNGKMMHPTGEIFEGEFKDGKLHGEGRVEYPSGEICKGLWVKGELVRRKLRSQRSQQRRLQASQMCDYCGVDDYRYKLRVCSGCNLAIYCSAACQNAASRSHRRICSIASELPPRDDVGLFLKYNRDHLVDLDAGLRYATKYMDNLKHLAIDVKEMRPSGKLSAKRLSSLLKSKKGALDSVTLVASDDFYFPGISHYGEAVWKQLHGLKQLRLMHTVFAMQPLCGIIGQQKNTLVVLCLPHLNIDWSRKCRRAMAEAITACKHLVKLDLNGSVLMDSDLKVMLHDLFNLRVLHLPRDTANNHEFTDNTCGLIARKCPGLQELNLMYHNHITVRGLRKIFEGCPNLLSFGTSTLKLSVKDIQTLLDSAPQLVHLCLDVGMHISEDKLSQIIEATGGRTVLQWSDDEIFEPCSKWYCVDLGGFRTITAKSREMYDCQRGVLNDIWIRQADPEVANGWEGVVEGERD